MTEELKQKAEEYADRHAIIHTKDVYIEIQDAYIAGATENGVQWHDLRKDTNDLPKGQINRFLFAYVKNYGGKKPMLVCYNGKWFYDANTYNDEVKVIQWCEIPQFKE
jgi:hypothetical protein